MKDKIEQLKALCPFKYSEEELKDLQQKAVDNFELTGTKETIYYDYLGGMLEDLPVKLKAGYTLDSDHSRTLSMLGFNIVYNLPVKVVRAARVELLDKIASDYKDFTVKAQQSWLQEQLSLLEAEELEVKTADEIEAIHDQRMELISSIFN